MVAAEVQWSELQRDPKGVAALADRGEVRVRRRDGVALLLVREDAASAASAGGLAAARTLRSALAHLSDEGAAEALSEEFPWVGQVLVVISSRRGFHPAGLGLAAFGIGQLLMVDGGMAA